MIIHRTLAWLTELFPCERRKPGWEKTAIFWGHRLRQSSFHSTGKSSSLR